ncbi:hypothetical protein [Glutamicibacter ardleyensis]|uniref:Uncharacterized protein n=1 Tax=Glutamicibacter ardleyensis TaxID=225894 RepID=A0ABQ2DVA1_9MICC|nr:hypothetical protein [Glutamicibacter ardleyensis]GGJ74556.1 hypothetical protein GCM10007173_36920 [Glutamicibacter ardleyensis]
MSRMDGRVILHPKGSGKPSATFDVSWLEYPKKDRAKQAVEVVGRWARAKYRGDTVVVEAGSIAVDGDQGVGHLHVNGHEIADFSAVVVPVPVPAASFFGGGR